MGSVKNNFRCSVPTSHHVFRKPFLNLLLLVASGKAEITNLEFTALVEENVTGLEITMDDVGGVEVEAATEELVHEVLHVLVREFLSGVDHSVHVRLHQLRDDVNILVACLCWRLKDIN